MPQVLLRLRAARTWPSTLPDGKVGAMRKDRPCRCGTPQLSQLGPRQPKGRKNQCVSQASRLAKLPARLARVLAVGRQLRQQILTNPCKCKPPAWCNAVRNAQKWSCHSVPSPCSSATLSGSTQAPGACVTAAARGDRQVCKQAASQVPDAMPLFQWVAQKTGYVGYAVGAPPTRSLRRLVR